MAKKDSIKLAVALGLFLVAGVVIFFTMREPKQEVAAPAPAPSGEQAAAPTQPGQSQQPTLKIEGDPHAAERSKGPIRVAPGGG